MQSLIYKTPTMQPRRPDSKKWTQLPKELTQKIRIAVEDSFKKELKNHEIICEGKIYQSELAFRIGYTIKGQLKQPNFEVSFDIGENKDEVWSYLQLGMDFIQATMMDYFADMENLELPLSWKKINFKNQTLYFQHSTINTELENLADKLLGEDTGHNLVEATPQTEDAFEMSEIEDEESLNLIKSKRHLH